jgi:2-polyprenyl-6-methoxyphenol hydroxylase-like FAD-dependent oxidoreductase
MSKTLFTTVLVVGSGPIGLWLAYELRRAGLAVLVIDTLPSREARCPYSKALSMSAGTLETFESRGIAKYFLSSGMPLPRTHFGGLPTSVLNSIRAYNTGPYQDNKYVLV